MFKRLVYLFMIMFVVGSYSLMGMNNVDAEFTLEEPVAVNAAANAGEVANVPVDGKHGEGKALATKTPGGEMSDFMRIAIATRLEATGMKNEQYLAILEKKAETFKQLEDEADKLTMPLEMYLESIEAIAKGDKKNETSVDKHKCMICSFEKPSKEFDKLRCDHEVCTLCLTDMSLDGIRSRDMSRLVCPKLDCRKPFDPRMDSPQDTKETKRPNNIEIPKELKDVLQKLGTKSCPNCQMPIEKNGGCQFVKCNNCTKDFCWYCFGPYDHKLHNCRPEGVLGRQYWLYWLRNSCRQVTGPILAGLENNANAINRNPQIIIRGLIFTTVFFIAKEIYIYKSNSGW